jgi:formate hydrogenlyase transcriptional activator
MNINSQPAVTDDVKRYEALIRLLGSLSSRTPEDLARNLAGELRSVLDFDFLDVLVYKDGTSEVLWQAIGTGQTRAMLNVATEEAPTWWVYQNQQPLAIADWNQDERFSSIKRALAARGFEVRSFCRLPLTTSHRRLGVFGIASLQPRTYSEEEIRFLSLLAEDLALVIDNALETEALNRAQAELEHKNTRLKLLLDLTNGITSNLDLRELGRTISASVRQVMDCDGVGIYLLDTNSGKLRLYALDFPKSKGFVHEEQTFLPGRAHHRAFETLKPVILNKFAPADFSAEGYEQTISEGFRAYCFVPLVNRGRTLGVLDLARMQENSFGKDDMEFLTQIAGQIAIAIENALAYREISQLKDKLAQEKLYLEEEIRSEMSFDQIIGNSPALKHALKLVQTVAPSDSTVLLLGETGTGKELIARAIHDRSRRKDRTFVKLNCAAIPTGLLESELFGHEKGAFTGAISQKIGRLQLADQGTLFLDEVGDIPIEIQPKLLRVLQEQEFERLGSTHTKKVNVRLVAATNRDLEKMIAAHEFRSDLFYRLNVFPIRIPPLRERREDIPLLVHYFAQKLAKRMQKNIETIPAAAIRTLANWDWPGNIRELENFIERAVILTRGKALEVPLAELKKSTARSSADSNNGPHGRDEIARIVREILNEMSGNISKRLAKEQDENDRQEIMRVLRETKGRVGGADGAAARMAINRTTLIARMKKLDINPKQFS